MRPWHPAWESLAETFRSTSVDDLSFPRDCRALIGSDPSHFPCVRAAILPPVHLPVRLPAHAGRQRSVTVPVSSPAGLAELPLMLADVPQGVGRLLRDVGLPTRNWDEPVPAGAGRGRFVLINSRHSSGISSGVRCCGRPRCRVGPIGGEPGGGGNSHCGGRHSVMPCRHRNRCLRETGGWNCGGEGTSPRCRCRRSAGRWRKTGCRTHWVREGILPVWQLPEPGRWSTRESPARIGAGWESGCIRGRCFDTKGKGVVP